MAKKDYQIPFYQGNQLHYAGSHMSIQWVDNFEFDDQLTFIDYARGRSAAYFNWKRRDGEAYAIQSFVKNIYNKAAVKTLPVGGVRKKSARKKRLD